MTYKPTLCLDFDGVLHSYTSKWQGATVIPDPPVPGARQFLLAALEKFDVCVLSSRSHESGGRLAMAHYVADELGGIYDYNEEVGVFVHFEVHGEMRAVTFPLHKPPAHLTIDDRALTFSGTWPDVDRLLEFKPWNRGGVVPAVYVPAEGTDDRGVWLGAAEQHGFSLCEHYSDLYKVSEAGLLSHGRR